MRWVIGLVVAGVLGVLPVRAQVAPPSILKEDCTKLKGKAKARCEASNKAPEAPARKPADASSDMPTGADADVPGEPPTVRPSVAPKAKPDTSDMPTGRDADPPAESLGPLKPDGTPDTEAGRSSSSSSSSSSTPAGGSSPAEDDDAPPTTAGGDSPVKAATLKDLGSHADSSAARAKLEANRVADDLKIGRFYMQDGNLTGAEARFKDALQHDPEEPEAHFALAELMLKQKRNDEAAAQLRAYLQLAPDDDHTKEAKKLLAKLGK